MGNPMIVGVDIGTSGTKSIVTDASGRIRGRGLHEYGINKPKPNWAEQDPNWWIDGVKNSVADAMAASGADWGEIAGIGMTHQRMTILPVDKSLDPVYPAVLWCDLRMVEEAKWATENIGGQKIFEQTGFAPSIWAVYKGMWFKKNIPDLYAKIHHFLCVPDWIIYKMTGVLATSESTAVSTGGLDIKSKNRFHVELLRECGLRPDAFVSDIRPAGEMVGKVSREGEQLFGIPAGVPVVLSAGDQPCGTLGAGQFEKGTLSVNGGTSCTCEAISSSLPTREHLNYFVEISPTGSYILENAVLTGIGRLMKWYRAHFGQAEEEKSQRTGENVWAVILEQANQTPVGNHGLFLVPYLEGSLAPYWNNDAKATLLNLSVDHGKPHIMRAIAEGLAYETRKSCELMEEDMGETIHTVISYGGASVNDIWNQILADTLNKKVLVSTNPETTSLGAAMCAAAGVGIYEDVPTAAKEMVMKMGEVSPDSQNAAFYDRFYTEVYKDVYDVLNDKLARGFRLAAAHASEATDA